MSDDGETLRNLALMGVKHDSSPKRKEIVKSILTNHGVTLNRNEITVKGSISRFPQLKHNIISAISDVSNLYVMVQSSVRQLFADDVREYFDEKGIIYSSSMPVEGKSGLYHKFDLQIAGKGEEILIRPIGTFNQVAVESYLFGWM